MKVKNQGLTEIKRELEALKAANASRLKELEYANSTGNKKLE